MKKLKLLSVFTVLALCSVVLFSCITSFGDTNVSVYVDGVELKSDVSATIENSRTLVPLRAIAESVGLTVNWDENTQKITLQSPTDVVNLYIGNSTAYKNNSPIVLDTAPKIINRRTFVPLRFVGECFGFEVNWDGSSKTVTLSSTIPAEGALSVYVLDVGQADSIFVRFPTGDTMLVDGGNAENAGDIINFLKKQNVTKLSYLVGTHPHSDHIGGLSQIITEIGAEKIYMPNISHNTATFENTLLAIKNSGNKIITAKAGVVITKGEYQNKDFSAHIIAPCKNSYDELNNYSAVIMLSFGNRRILLTGDAETLSENQIPGDISADVLKVGHHGSNTSTGESFLKRVDPDHAIISVGKDNSYGHPSDKILNRLKSFGCNIYRTDLNGTIAVITDGKRLSVSPYSDTTLINGIPTDLKVYIAKNGNKYHYRDCSGLNQSSYITEITLSLAREQGRVPCKMCNPPE